MWSIPEFNLSHKLPVMDSSREGLEQVVIVFIVNTSNGLAEGPSESPIAKHSLLYGPWHPNLQALLPVSS